MILITVEMIPFGIEANKTTLGTVKIANDMTGTPEYGNYKVTFDDDILFIKRFKRDKGIEELVYEILKKRLKKNDSNSRRNTKK